MPTIDPTLHDEVILLHFGGPEDETQVYPFLVNLFEDPLIIRASMPKWFRRFLARRIAKKRTPETTEQYRKISFSPINRFTEAQARLLEGLLRESHSNVRVHTVNRYTAPFAHEVVNKIHWEQSRVFILSLYPHFCHSTTASSFKDLDDAVRNAGRHQSSGSVRIFTWWQNPRYLHYSWELIKAKLEPLCEQDAPIRILLSAHGIPAKYAERGDPYPHEIRGHFSALQAIGNRWLKDSGFHHLELSWHLSFQSRVGPVEWLRPYTEDAIADLGQKGGGHLLIVPISFVSDHIETLYEMDVEYRKVALNNGFQSYIRTDMPNDQPALAQCLADVLTKAGF